MGGVRASDKTAEAGTDKQCWISVGEGSVGGHGEGAHADEGQAMHPPRREGWGKWSGVGTKVLFVAGGGVVGWSAMWCAPRHFELT